MNGEPLSPACNLTDSPPYLPRASRMDDFERLYEAYARDVYRFALYLSGSPAQAEDIASETFVRVWTTMMAVTSRPLKEP